MRNKKHKEKNKDALSNCMLTEYTEHQFRMTNGEILSRKIFRLQRRREVLGQLGKKKSKRYIKGKN